MFSLHSSTAPNNVAIRLLRSKLYISNDASAIRDAVIFYGQCWPHFVCQRSAEQRKLGKVPTSNVLLPYKTSLSSFPLRSWKTSSCWIDARVFQDATRTRWKALFENYWCILNKLVANQICGYSAEIERRSSIFFFLSFFLELPLQCLNGGKKLRQFFHSSAAFFCQLALFKESFIILGLLLKKTINILFFF